MKIQSLSIVVPGSKCINQCKFCVSCMHANDYPNLMDVQSPRYGQSVQEYLKRLAYARDNGCNTLMLTGSVEPQQNRPFLATLGLLNKMLPNPFRNIEIQTTGAFIDYGYLTFLKEHVGVTTVALSVASFDDVETRKITNMKDENFNLQMLCQDIKTLGLNLRLSLNLTSAFNGMTYKDILEHCDILGADQVTFRVMYSDGNNPQAQWLKNHAFDYKKAFGGFCTDGKVVINPGTKDAYVINPEMTVGQYVKTHGRYLGTLPYGFVKYAVKGKAREMCVVVDDDCMAKGQAEPESYKYLILRPDCKLYSSWDNPGSLIF